MVTKASIANKYQQKANQITASYNAQEQGLRNEENTLQNQMNQLKGQQQQDQNGISQEQQNINSVAKQEQDLSNTMSGSGSVGSQYQTALSSYEKQTGYDETSMQAATAAQQAATGSISAYKDTLKTAWASQGQSNDIYQHQQQQVEGQLNANVQATGKDVNTLEGAYEAATSQASKAAAAYYEGEQNQMTSYENLSTTYQGLLTQSIQKYENDVKAYSDAASAYTIASEQYSFATEVYGYAIEQNAAAEQEDVYARITMPSIAAANYALAAQANALASSYKYTMEKAQKVTQSTAQTNIQNALQQAAFSNYANTGKYTNVVVDGVMM